jgi:hypothetical protein
LKEYNKSGNTKAELPTPHPRLKYKKEQELSTLQNGITPFSTTFKKLTETIEVEQDKEV